MRRAASRRIAGERVGTTRACVAIVDRAERAFQGVVDGHASSGNRDGCTEILRCHAGVLDGGIGYVDRRDYVRPVVGFTPFAYEHSYGRVSWAYGSRVGVAEAGSSYCCAWTEIDRDVPPETESPLAS